MRYIFIQPAILRLVWELEVAIYRMMKLGVKAEDITIILDTSSSRYAERLSYLGCEIICYQDNRMDKRYIPSIRPFFWQRYLLEDPAREQGTYFYLDSDTLFSDIPKVKPTVKRWYASDCTNYLGHKYIDSKGEGLLERMASIVKIDPAIVRSHDIAAGAHWVIKNPTAAYWGKVYADSINLYAYLCSVESQYVRGKPKGYVPIQKWTAEMWAQLWNVYLLGIEAKAHKELSFVFATDTRDRAEQVKIVHNAGARSKHKDRLFQRSEYRNSEPFEADLSFVDPTSASWVYVQGIKEVRALAKHRVIKGFRDKTDSVPYYVGDKFPKPANKIVPDVRLKMLIRKGLIEAIEEVEEVAEVEKVEAVEED